MLFLLIDEVAGRLMKQVHVLGEAVSGASNATPSLEDILCSRERCGSCDYVTKYLCT